MTAETTQGPIYRDSTRPIGERVSDLLSMMTLEEKLAQLGSAWVFSVISDGELVTEEADRLLGAGIGQITRVSGATNLEAEEAARAGNQIQRFLVERTRLGTPAIIHEEVCAGLMARHATSFPQAIGVASTWQPALVEALAGVVRTEMLAVGARQGLSPVLDVCRDPRWGRTEETFGEDPHLVAVMGSAFIRGLQGDDLRHGVVATAKHFVGYGASEGGMNWAPAPIGRRELADVYLHPFEAAVRSAGLRSVMTAYHELDGVPSTADSALFDNLLRKEWGFSGIVVSDYFAIRQLVAYHRYVADPAAAAAIALRIGVDAELPSTDCYGDPLAEALAAGLAGEDTVDAAVARVLHTKFELGLFESPYVDEARVTNSVATPASVELAGEVARQSIVLLKNDGALPLQPGLSIALIGPNADAARHLFGDYSYPAHAESLSEVDEGDNVFSIPLRPGSVYVAGDLHTPTVRDALTARLGARVAFAPGCDISGASMAGFDEAVELARHSDVAVMVMGDKAGLTDDCTSGEGRDRASLDLPGVQEDLVEAVAATGTPVVLVLVAGRPSGSPAVHEAAVSVVMAWLPGRHGADAIADVLLGKVNPGGKLPISYPRSAGQVPVYHSHKVSGNRSHWKIDYADLPASPLYPFGHGLSYTTFKLNASLDPVEVRMDGSVTVSVDVSNTGDRDGDEVVQVYVRDLEASVTRPVSELKGFARVNVPAEASRKVVFRLEVGQLGFCGPEYEYVVEPGEFEVSVGTSATDRLLAGTFTVVGEGAVKKSFSGAVELIG